MNVALICPSNLLYMPYVRKYEELLRQYSINYEFINWDRSHIEDDNDLTYKDFKVGHQRNLFDYLKFKKFIINSLNNSNYDKIIVFGIQLSFFLSKYLTNKYKHNYVIDIRDYHKFLNLLSIKKLVDCSFFTAISSPGFLEWLPSSNKYIVSHNTKITDIYEYYDKKFAESCLTLSYIGSIRDLNENIKLISDLRNSKKIQLEYDGEGIANTELSQFIRKNNIQNVDLTGRYQSEKEKEFYNQSDLINILIPNTDINSRTLLTNRLYQAVIYGKPILANEGSYQANIIKKYNLGLVINEIENVEKKIFDYFNKFDVEKYNLGRKLFVEKVLLDNKHFEIEFNNFLNKN
jgi:hypothetical protein